MNATPFFTENRLGANMERTKEGYLLCRNVPIARTGTQLYSHTELQGVQAGADGLIRVERRAEDVFDESSLQTLQGKPVVNDHPWEVNSKNWVDLAKGIVFNPRRGEGVYDDCVVADLLITDEETIKDVLAGKRELSAGYDADYYEYEPGRARQHNIKFNHAALVKSGRCGSRCSIKDHARRGETQMAKTTLKKTFDALRAAFS